MILRGARSNFEGLLHRTGPGFASLVPGPSKCHTGVGHPRVQRASALDPRQRRPRMRGNLIDGPHLSALTGLRFVAAAAVLIHHSLPVMVDISPPTPIMLFAGAFAAEGMSLFFVVSGFLIYLNYSASIREPGGLRQFLVRRFARIYPLYFLVVAYDVLVHFSWYSLSGETLIKVIPWYLSLTQSWIYLSISNEPIIYALGSVPSITWSISTEIFFYAVFPLLCIAIVRIPSAALKILAMLILVMCSYGNSAILFLARPDIIEFGVRAFGNVAVDGPNSFYRWLAYFAPYVRVLEFSLGCLVAAVYMDLSNRKISAWEVWAATIATVLALSLILCLHILMFATPNLLPSWARFLPDSAMNFGFAPFLAVIIFCCARYVFWLSRWLSRPWLILCGEASYALYLLHVIVIAAFRFESPKVTTVRTLVGSLAQWLFVLAVCVGVSILVYRVIELPARRSIRNLLTRTVGST